MSRASARRWVALVACACSACAEAVELDPREFDRPEASAPGSAGRGGGGVTGGLAGAPPSNGGQAGSLADADADADDRVDERPTTDERSVVDARIEDVACATCALRVQYRAGDTNATDNQVKPQFNVVNRGTTAVPLADLTLRYWWTEASTPEMFFCDYAKVGASNVVGRFGSLPVERPKANGYLEVGFTEAAGSLAPADESGEIQGRCQKADYSAYQEADDYSFDPGATAFADAPRVTLYRGGVLVWGVEP
jgi:hypothetical protein